MAANLREVQIAKIIYPYFVKDSAVNFVQWIFDVLPVGFVIARKISDGGFELFRTALKRCCGCSSTLNVSCSMLKGSVVVLDIHECKMSENIQCCPRIRTMPTICSTEMSVALKMHDMV